MSTADIIHTTADKFGEQVIERSKTLPVLVDFWAEWCGPCKAIAPVLEQLAAANSDKLVVAKVDVDAHGSCARDYGVAGIPTLILFSGGEEKQRAVGAISLAQCQELIQPFVEQTA